MTRLRCFARLTQLIGVSILVSLAAPTGGGQVPTNKKEAGVVVPGPGDSPITIRGGSVVAHQGFTGEAATFACYPASASSPCQEVSGTYTYGVTTVQLDRTVTLGSKTPYTPAQLILTPPATTDWMIALTFRDKNGQDGSGAGAAEVDICSNSDCTTDGARKTAATTIYMFAPNPATGEFTSRTLDSTLIHYSVSYCGQSPGDGSICDHIYKIQLSSGFTVQGTTNPAPTPLLCVDGACEITLKK